MDPNTGGAGFDELVIDMVASGISIRQTAKELGVVRGKIQSVVKRHRATIEARMAELGTGWKKNQNSTGTAQASDFVGSSEPRGIPTVTPEQLAAGPRTEWDQEANEGTATVSSNSAIKTLAELMEACDIDIKIWKPTTVKPNKWGVAMKVKQEDGSERVVTVPIFQIKATFVLRVADESFTEFPPIRPVRFPIKKMKAVKRKPSDIETHVIVPDSQMGFIRHDNKGVMTYEPFHDRRALDIALQIIDHLKPDGVHHLGDMQDLAEWSDKFVVSPEYYFTTQPAIAEGGWWWTQVRMLAGDDCDLTMLEGNHEERMQRLVKIHLRAAYGLKAASSPPEAPPEMSIENLLGLPELGVNYLGPYPKAQKWLGEHLRLEHGEVVRGRSPDTVKAIVRDQEHSSICGHVHRVEMASETRHTKNGPKVHTAISLGTTARIDGTVPATKNRANWQQALGVVYLEKSTGRFHVDPIHITKGKAIFEGQLFEGVDYGERLSEDTGWKLDPFDYDMQ